MTKTIALKHAHYAAATQSFLEISRRYLAIRAAVAPALIHAHERGRALLSQGVRLGAAPQSFTPYFKQR